MCAAQRARDQQACPQRFPGGARASSAAVIGAPAFSSASTALASPSSAARSSLAPAGGASLADGCRVHKRASSPLSLRALAVLVSLRRTLYSQAEDGRFEIQPYRRRAADERAPVCVVWWRRWTPPAAVKRA